MDQIIQKYDYANSTEETHQALQNDLKNVNTTKLAGGLNLASVKNIINIFIQKICIKEYVQNNPRFSPGTWMATITFRDIAAIMRECINAGTISESDCYDCLFDLLLAMVRAGPGTSHLEVIVKLHDVANMKQYLKNLKGEKLEQMATALKAHTHIPEKDMSSKDYTRLLGENLARLLKSVFEKRDDIKELDVWTTALDLHLFYLQHTNDVPDDIHTILESCRMAFYRMYDRNPYKGYPDTKVIRQHIQIIETFVTTPGFPRGGQLSMAKDFVHFLTNIEGDKLEVVWPELMSLWKTMSLLENAREISEMIEKIQHLFDRIDADTIKTNRTIFETWASTANEIFNKTTNSMVLADILPRMIRELDTKYTPAKGDEDYWYPIIKGLLSIPKKEALYRAKYVLRDSKYKRMWNWKQHIQDAKEIICVVDKLDLPTKEEGNDHCNTRDCNSNCGEAIKEMIKMLKIQKIEHLIMADLGRMTFTHMEKRSIFSNAMVHCYLRDLDFQKVNEVVPEIMRRFETLITDTDYPWLEGWCLGNGLQIFQRIIEAYSSGSDIPAEINQSLTRILLFCMEDDCERMNIEDGHQTVWGAILQSSITFVAKHCVSGTADVCLPFLKEVLKFRYSDEKSFRDVCSNNFLLVGQRCPDVCVKMFDPLLDWYIEEPSANLMQIFWSIGNTTPDVLNNKLDRLIEVCKDDTETYSVQAVLFYTLSAKRPEMFTQKVVDVLMEFHFHTQDIRIQVLTVMMNVTKENQQLFVKHMETILNYKSVPTEQHFINGTLVNVATRFKKFKEPVFNYLITVLKAATDDTQLAVTITGLKGICVKYGSQMFHPYQEYLLNRRDKEHNPTIKEQFSELIDYIEGRSLETVARDVKETQDDVDQLDTRVTDTETAIGTLTDKVEEHDEEIGELGDSVDTVTKRVDFAEKDIEETKVKVEEIDNKTMINAPKWSRDLTKLMNPTNEYDWRFLAQRLGYSNDDIRAWGSQHDPCMAVLSEWYATHKTREATYAVLTALQEMNRDDGASIVENAMKATEDIIEDEEFEYKIPPPVFLSYQWGHQDEVKLIRNHLQMAGYECWMDIGQMGGGDKLFEKIDNGIRGAKIVISCVSEKYAKSPNCNREVNLSVTLGKPMIPLLMEKMNWPPKGSMGPIFSEYLFVRFFQRSGEETNDDRTWPVAKFQEMLMQLNCYGIKPEESSIADRYKNWWLPVQETIVIDKAKKNANPSKAKQTEQTTEKEKQSPDVFISYQWGKQKQIIALYQRLTGLGLSCWMDIHQMGGGDSLYEKIDSGVRGCKVVLTCITQKYSLSANCRREVSLADALKKPIIPLLLEKIDWPPSGPMSMVFTQLLFINFYRDESVQLTWNGPTFDDMMGKIGEHVDIIIPSSIDENVKEVEVDKEVHGKDGASLDIKSTKTSVSPKHGLPLHENNKGLEDDKKDQTTVQNTDLTSQSATSKVTSVSTNTGVSPDKCQGLIPSTVTAITNDMRQNETEDNTPSPSHQPTSRQQILGNENPVYMDNKASETEKSESKDTSVSPTSESSPSKCQDPILSTTKPITMNETMGYSPSSGQTESRKQVIAKEKHTTMENKPSETKKSKSCTII